MPRIGGKMRLGLHRARPETPYFYNMYVGREGSECAPDPLRAAGQAGDYQPMLTPPPPCPPLPPLRFTGEGLAGIADSTSLKKLALGKPLNRGPYQELAAPGSQVSG